MAKSEVTAVRPGDIYWVRPDAVVGREQQGRCPFAIVASAEYLEIVDSLALGVPLTTTNRNWPNHVPVALPGIDGFAMTEQLRSVSRDRFDGYLGRVDEETFKAIRGWLADYLGF